MNKLIFILISTLAWQVTESQSVKCKYNEEYAVDVSRPQNTCDWYGCYGQYICPYSNIVGGACYCKEGYARWGSSGGLCIPITSILCAPKLPPNPKQCAERKNEVYYLDAPARTCDDSCKNYGRYCRPIETFAIDYVRPYCACKEGFARLQNGTCVSVDDSSCFDLYKPSEENCSERGEVFGKRGGCDFIADCEHPDPPTPPPPGEIQVCPMFVMDVCLCPSGLLRNSLGECVERRHC